LYASNFSHRYETRGGICHPQSPSCPEKLASGRPRTDRVSYPNQYNVMWGWPEADFVSGLGELPEEIQVMEEPTPI